MPGLNETTLYGPAPMGAALNPSSPTFSTYFFGTIRPTPPCRPAGERASGRRGRGRTGLHRAARGDERGSVAWRPSSIHHRDHLDLDEEVGVGQPADLDGGARRQRAEVFHADVGVLEELLDIGDVGVRLHDVAQRGPGGSQRRLDVLAHLTDLRAHVAAPNGVAVPVPRELAGHEDRLLPFDDHDVGVQHVPAHHPLAQSLRLDVLALHGLSPWSRSRRTIAQSSAAGRTNRTCCRRTGATTTRTSRHDPTTRGPAGGGWPSTSRSTSRPSASASARARPSRRPTRRRAPASP